ncbi:TPA: type II secretion system F family protein [Candidatus Bathyarchaeota archaeon]|nr:type II secretion system F family protein [Candidatus Bathyarchaeota archaeon]
MKKLLLLIPSTSIAVFLVLFSWLYLQPFPTLFQAVIAFSLGLAVAPVLLTYYVSYRRKKEMEEMFPVFMRDFVEAVRGGMNVPQAFERISKNDYRSLSPLIKKIAAQLEWGIPLEKVMRNFVKATGSRSIGRVVSSIIESHRFGGNLADTFEALSGAATEIDRLRKERTLYLQSQIITGYVVFFVFLGVMVALIRFLVPTLAEAGPVGLGVLRGGEERAVEAGQMAAAFRDIFFHLILIQGLFAGLSVGKMAEGSILPGLKHSLIMISLGALVFLFAVPG